MTGAPGPLVPAALSAESWDIVFQQTLSFADYQVNRLRGRHQFGGLLPGGFDAKSIAQQAIMEFLQQSPESSQVRPLTRSGAAPGLEPVLWEVKRLVLKQVTHLHHLKENWLLSSEADLPLVPDQDGDLVSPTEFIPDPDPHPDTALLEKESLAQLETSKSRFSSFINRESRLSSLFELLCDGVEKPQALASSLKLRLGTVRNLRKRLRRRWRRFGDSIPRK